MTLMKWLRNLVVLAVTAFPLVPAAADDGPDVSITPDSGEYTIPVNTTKSVSVKIAFSDPDGLRQDTLKITLGIGGNSSPVTGFTWVPNAEGTFALAQGTIVLRSAGDNLLRAEIADKTGKLGSGWASFNVTIDNPNLGPVISKAPHHDGYRMTSLGAATLSYAMPSYVSLDIPRSFGLYYNSQHADPTGFVQLDVDTGTAPDGSQAAGVSLQIFTAVGANDDIGEQVTTETVWVKEPTAKQRVGAQWPMRHKPTGAYRYVALVRAYRSDKTLIGQKQVAFRMLTVNNMYSRYGAGWNPALQRLYPVNDGKVNGVMIHEGEGVVRFWEIGSCTGIACDYKSPAGDFSRITFKTSPSRYERAYSDGTVLTFNGDGLLVSAADRFGRATSYTWALDADSPRPPAPLLLTITDPAGKGWYTEYFDGFLSAIIDPLERRADLTYDWAARTLTRVDGPTTLAGMVYNTAGRLTSYRDAAGSWSISYGGPGTVYQIRTPVVEADGEDVRLATTFQSVQGLTVPAVATSRYGTWAPALPADKVLISVKDALNHPTYYQFDRYGNVTKFTDPEGRSMTSVYNEDGLPERITNSVQELDYAWSSRGHLLSQSVNGSVVYSASYFGDQLEYEARGADARWYSYGARGELTLSWTGKKEDFYRTATTYEYYDDLRLKATNGPSGERAEWAYDNVWRNVSQFSTSRADGVKLTSRTTYDNAGRPLVATDPLSQTITFTWDALNRPLEVKDLLNRTIRYGYTGLNLASVTDQAGKTYGFKYNALGWLISETFPEDDFTRSYRYNRDGQVISATDRRDQTVTTTWDDAHQIATRTADGVTATFTYDLHTAVASNNETKETIIRHPWLGNVDLFRATLGGPNSTRYYEIGTVYDEGTGWLNTGVDVRQYHNGSLLRNESIRYGYDSNPTDTTLAHTISIQDFAGRVTTLGYDASGRQVRTQFPNGVTQYNWYFADGLMSGRTYSSSSLNQELGTNYAYDHLGRLTERTSLSMNTRWGYEYDYQGQLTSYQNQQRGTPPGCDPSQSECDPIWLPGPYETYSYDAVGNRTDSGAVLIPKSNRYRTFNGFGPVSGADTGMTYDREGNLIRKYKAGFEQQLTWNALGQLASVTTNGVTVTYGYSPSGRRIRRTENGQTIYYIYHDDNLLMEIDGNGNPIRAYTHMPGLDRPLSVKVGGDSNFSYYYTMEQPGHVSALLSLSGAIAARYRYAPFGRVESSTGSVSQSLKFMARELDNATGLYYVRARWYDPSLARFVSSDPIGLEGGINTYAYVGNAPMDALDPSGLQYQYPSCIGPDGKNKCIEPMIVEVCSRMYPFARGCSRTAPWNWKEDWNRNAFATELTDVIDAHHGQRAAIEAGRRAPDHTRADTGRLERYVAARVQREWDAARCTAATAWDGAMNFVDNAKEELATLLAGGTTLRTGVHAEYLRNLANSYLQKTGRSLNMKGWQVIGKHAGARTAADLAGWSARGLAATVRGARRHPYALGAAAATGLVVLNAECFRDPGN